MTYKVIERYGVNDGNNLSILSNACCISLENVQKYSCPTWIELTPVISFNDPISNDFDAVDLDSATSTTQHTQFHCQFKSIIILLILEKSKFEWNQLDGTVVNDGLTMLCPKSTLP